jgi:hypothetical protein
MTSRRSILKGMAAACLGGWWGLGARAAASPAATDQTALPSSDGSSSCACELPNSMSSDASPYSCTYTYDVDGRLRSACYCGAEVTYYEFPALAEATQTALA